MKTVLAVAIGGAFGAMARYWLSQLADRWATGHGLAFPVGTLLVNVVGSFVFGFLVFGLLKHAPEPLRLLVLTGFLGAFTTFSTFASNTVNLIHQDQWFLSAVNIVLNVLGSICAFMIAVRLGQGTGG